MRPIRILVLAALVLPALAAAEEAPLEMKSLRLRLSGTVYALWGYDLTGPNPDGPADDTVGSNRFDVTRAYVNVEPQLGEKVWLRITPDVVRVADKVTDANKNRSNLDGSLAFRLKYAYLQVNDVVPGIAVKAGMQHTAWIDFEDSIWKHRVLGPVGLETFTGMSSADLGLGLIGKHAGGLLEWQVVGSNGEGYSKPEQSGARVAKYKELGTRVTLAPLAGGGPWAKGLRLSGHLHYGITGNVGDELQRAERIRLLGLASWETKRFTLGAGGGSTVDGVAVQDDAGDDIVKERSGLLAMGFGFVNLPVDLRLLGRVDTFDPDVDLSPVDDPGEDTTSGRRTRLIAGLGWQAHELVYLVADVQRFVYEEPENTKGSDPGSAFFLHLDARF